MPLTAKIPVHGHRGAANTPEVWDKLIDAKVDGITTDDPAVLIAY